VSRRAAVLTGVAALLLGGCGEGAVRGSTPAAPVAVAVAQGCPPATALHVDARVRVGRGVGPLAIDQGRLWAARPAAGELVLVRTGARSRIARRVRVGGAPVSLAAAFGNIWVADRDGGRILRVGLVSAAVAQWAEVDAPVKIAVAGERLFAISLDDGALYALNPRTRGAGVDIAIPARGPVDAIQQGGELWVLGGGDSGLSPLDLRTGAFRRAGVRLPVRVVGAIAAGHGAVWAALPTARAVARVDPASLSVGIGRASNGFRPTVVAVDSCTVWLGDADGRVARLDPDSRRPVGRPLRIGRSLAALVADRGGMWASDPRDGTVVRVAPGR
jgi:DNA-binding beta-propeller fold protein YncE